MIEPVDIAALRRALTTVRAGRPALAPTPECLGDDLIAAFAEGGLDAAARTSVLPHLASCLHCRTALTSVALTLADPRVARESGPRAGARRRFLTVAIPAAAAAGLLILAWPHPTVDRTTVHRAPTITAAGTPALLSPIGIVDHAAVLRWGAVAGVDRYRVTLFDAQSRVRYEAELTDTASVLPDSVVIVPGERYLWKVEARTGFDRWVSSALADFRVAGGGPR